MGSALAKTMAHFFPKMLSWLAALADTRDQNRITYPREFLSWTGLMLFLLKMESRRQVRFELDSPEAIANLNRLAGCDMETLAHGDTLDHFMGHVPTGEYPRLRHRMVQRLVRMKALDFARLFGHFLLVIDGTGQFYFRQRHCPHCLTKTVNGKTQYYHHVLEAKLVTPSGLAISVGSEFIENADPNATKQDCELKAFARLAHQLKKDFPQLRLCLCLDGLYANDPSWKPAWRTTGSISSLSRKAACRPSGGSTRRYGTCAPKTAGPTAPPKASSRPSRGSAICNTPMTKTAPTSLTHSSARNKTATGSSSSHG